MNFDDGSEYYGRWVNDKMDGLGRYIDVNGAIIYGIWCENKLA